MKLLPSRFLFSNLKSKTCGGERGRTIQHQKWAGLFAIVVALTVCGASAEAQQPKKMSRIGYLSSGTAIRNAAGVEAIRQALRDRGYIEGQNIITEYRYGEGKLSRVPDLAAELTRLKVDVLIVAGGAGVVQAAQNATKTIPIVMTGQGIDPVEAGLIKSLARPGGNVTGVTNLSGELGGKKLEMLKEAVPKLARVAVLYDPAAPGSVREAKELLPVAARVLKLAIQSWEVKTADSLDGVFAALAKQRPDGLHVPVGPILRNNGKRIVTFALKNRLPSVHSNREDVDAGALMYYGADIEESFRQVVWYIDKILKGAKPAELPVQQPTKFEFVINLKTANQIGVEIPQWTLMKADRVIR